MIKGLILGSTFTSATIARQPIFDINLNTYAYELLYRGELRLIDTSLADELGDSATNQVLNNAFVDIGIENVVGKHIAFINMTRSLLIKGDPLPFMTEQVVLEILEDIVADHDVIAAVEKLVQQGYKIALDDFIFDESLRPLIKLADIIKIDILALSSEELEQHVSLLKQENVKLLAEKVETKQQYEQCKALGFDYFQGYFFSKPDLVEDDSPLPGSQLNTLKLIGVLQNPNADIDEIENLISLDVSLSYKLLKLLNSAAFSLPKEIESIKQGLVLLGLKAIKSWATLIALHSINSAPAELMSLTLIRAKMCSIIAPYFNAETDIGFTVGLFSTIEAMLQHPANTLLENLPLSSSVKQAVLTQQGDLGKMLKIVMLYEQGLWDNISTSFIDIEQLDAAYIDATKWAIDTHLST